MYSIISETVKYTFQKFERIKRNGFKDKKSVKIRKRAINIQFQNSFISVHKRSKNLKVQSPMAYSVNVVDLFAVNRVQNYTTDGYKELK